MTRYEPHCDCLGGHVSMVPDPNGRWCRADDPHPVADDPSGIVQQMPGGGDEGPDRLRLIRDQLGAHGDLFMRLNGFYRIGPAGPVEPEFGYRDFRKSEFRQPIQTEAADAIAALGQDLIARRATEADLRAEVERLRAALDPNQTKAAYIGEINMTVHDVCEDEDGNLVDHPREITVDWTTIKAVMAMIRARAALSPETDGGQDDR